MHNIGHHERTNQSGAGRTGWATRAWHRYSAMVDGFVSLTTSGVDEARAAFPALAKVPVRVIPHGHYRDAYPNSIGREAARASLRVAPDAHVALFFGQVRPYKGVVELVRCFRTITDQDAVLLVVGRPKDDEIAHAVETAASGDDRVHVHLGLVAVNEVQRYFNAADVVALPYIDTLNSGAALLALSFDRPIFAPARGAFAELRSRVGEEWARLYEGALDPQTLAGAFSVTAPSTSAPLDAFSWPRIGAETVDFYGALLGERVSSSEG